MRILNVYLKSETKLFREKLDGLMINLFQIHIHIQIYSVQRPHILQTIIKVEESTSILNTLEQSGYISF